MCVLKSLREALRIYTPPSHHAIIPCKQTRLYTPAQRDTSHGCTTAGPGISREPGQKETLQRASTHRGNHDRCCHHCNRPDIKQFEYYPGIRCCHHHLVLPRFRSRLCFPCPEPV